MRRGKYSQNYCIQYNSENVFEGRVYEFTVLLKNFRENTQWLEDLVPVSSSQVPDSSSGVSGMVSAYSLIFILLFSYLAMPVE